MKSLFLSLVAAVTMTGAAHATTLHATGGDASGVTGTRGTLSDAFGAADGNFISIGLGGQLDLTFGETFTGPGMILEVTYGSRAGYVETADIYGGNGGTFTFLGSVDNSSGTAVVNFSGIFDTLRIVDTSPFGAGRDGFDVDSVSVSAVPLPAAGLVLAGAVAGLSVLRRRKDK